MTLEQEAKVLVDKLQSTVASGGFELQQWASNKPLVISHLPAKLRSDSADITTIYQVLASQYDPIGFIVPYITRAKVVVQCLWSKKRDWDDPSLPEDLLQVWNEWESELPALQNIVLLRCYTSEEMDCGRNHRELHIFCDASEQAYGSVAYLQTENDAASPPPAFNISKCIALVPPFWETEVETYFNNFERDAVALQWPKDAWAVLLQCKPVDDQKEDVKNLIRSHSALFGDVPSRTTVLEHDIDVGNTSPIKQHAYRCPPQKRADEERAQASLTLNLAKCEFGKAVVTYLGKQIGHGEVRPLTAKVEAILSYPVPGTQRELRWFLGLIEVDASATGAGAVLLQDGTDDISHPISYFSVKFKQHQLNYSTTEKETLALLLALQHFEVYVCSSKDPKVIFTDHNPLVFLSRMYNHNQRLMRWALLVHEYNTEIRHNKDMRLDIRHVVQELQSVEGQICRPVSQPDCKGVDCPLLDNCIEEVLDSGTCCASCLQKGCTCEGYQYYDCINAGFKNGKVPEGDSYFVDYGSTECSCPEGGGRISCHFISCPDLPPNCIEMSEPPDGCMQCERVGCVHSGQKYEAGHSFHLDPCQVCHCPDKGGKLMCYPVPKCDPQKVHKPMLAVATDRPAARHESYPKRLDQQGHTESFSTAHHLTNGNLPLFKLPLLDIEEPEDYDYSPTDFPENYPQSFVLPTQTILSNQVVSVSHSSATTDQTSSLQSFDRQGKLELREQYGVHDHSVDNEEVTESPSGVDQTTVKPQGTNSWLLSRGLTGAPNVLLGVSNTQREPELQGYKSLGSVILPLNQELVNKKIPQYLHVNSESAINPQRSTETKAHQHNVSNSVTIRGSVGQTDLSLPLRVPEMGANQQRGTDLLKFPLYIPRNPESSVHSQAVTNDHKELWGAVFPSKEIFSKDALEVGKEEEVLTFRSVSGSEGNDVPYQIKSVAEEKNHKNLESVNLESSNEKASTEHGTPTPRWPEYTMPPMVHFTTTAITQSPVTAKLNDSQPSRRPEQKLFGFNHKDRNDADKGGRKKEEEEEKRSSVLFIKPDEGLGVSAENLLHDCCSDGQRWASENSHCNHLPLLDKDKYSLCSITQKQCCLGSVRESHCDAGVTSAKAGVTCEVDEKDSCADDSYQVCCSCCTLGLRVLSEGRGCEAHQHLVYPCGHIFLTCCEGNEDLSQNPLRTKQKPQPMALPRKVSDSKFPKEAFSITATDDTANTVQEEEVVQEEDVDECELYHGQLCQHMCTNIWGSYRCGCHQGYILQLDGHSCAPVSPEEDNRVKEVDSPALGPIKTSTTTTMATASPTTTTYTNIHFDPCADNSGCDQHCTVVAERPHCSCFPGFSLMTDGQMCQDVDECMTNTHSCRPSERCVNTVGSFVCELQVACPAGYQLRNALCEDVDECTLQTHDCGVGFMCENILGSFLCQPKHKCMSGFTQDSHGNCIDINECSSLTEPCSSGSHCINTVGSYMCQQKIVMCSHGYHTTPEGAKCVDIDECQMGSHRCGVGQICHNLPGSYRCECQTGYQYDARRKVCTDVNECWRYPGRLCGQTCENTPGSYHCSCTAGFTLTSDGKNCEDVNECHKNPCSQECANIYGSYQCYCRQGYHLKEDGHSCEDIDECSQSIGNLCAFQCVNVVGSYQCACPPHGYVMSTNGRTCRDIDECTTGTHNCSHQQTCYNLQGGFRCLSFSCPHNYRKVSNTRCERLSCPTNSLECQNSPVRITYYHLSFQTNIIIPAQIFRIGPSPAYAGDHVIISITRGNEEGYFSTRKLNSFTGAIYMQRKVHQPKDFLIDVEMKLLRQGKFTTYLAKIYIFITSSTM
ncbi:fibulin-2 [Pholidichthys leucotaenia]